VAPSLDFLAPLQALSQRFLLRLGLSVEQGELFRLARAVAERALTGHVGVETTPFTLEGEEVECVVVEIVILRLVSAQFHCTAVLAERKKEKKKGRKKGRRKDQIVHNLLMRSETPMTRNKKSSPALDSNG
jgi:hypothetical protein